MDVRYKVGIGLLTLGMLLGSLVALLAVSRTESAFLTPAQSLLRARRSSDDTKLKFEPVIRHHVVHTEVNSHIGLENFLKIAAEKKSEEEQLPENNIPEEESIPVEIPEEIPEIEPETEPEVVPELIPEVPETPMDTYENNINEMNRLMINPKLEIMLPSFDICPIGPELPGESGSIRKVRDTERAKVDRRISG
jgi:hypothetical protein